MFGRLENNPYFCIRKHTVLFCYTRYYELSIQKSRFDMEDYSDYSAPELVRVLGSRFKDYRLRANMTQKEVAEMAGLSVLSVYRFENGTVTSISLSTFLLLMKAVGCINDLNELMPEQPESPYLYKDTKKIQRVRHKKV